MAGVPSNGDGAAMQALASRLEAPTVETVGPIGESGAELLSLVGSRTSAVIRSAEAADLVRNDLDRRREAVSGVNLDEEFATLTAHEQAYQVASRLIQVSASITEEMMSLFR